MAVMTESFPAAYLKLLPSAQLHVAAALTNARHWDAVIGGALLVLAAAVVFRADLLCGRRARIEAERPRPWLATAATALALGAILILTSALWAGAAAWRERRWFRSPELAALA